MPSTLLLCTALCAIALLCALRWPPQAALHTQIDIGATPEQVWELLGQPASYASWNPFIVSMQGQLAEGQQLRAVMQSPGRKAMAFKPRVLKVDAARELRWRGRLLMPGIFDGEHYFELQRNANGTRLLHGETFSGVLLWVMDIETFKPDFERMNAALKRACESGAKRD